MIVVGGFHSSNTSKLYEICKQNCENTIHVENSGEIPDEIINSKKIKNVGVTAGASTPEWIIKEAILKMNENTMEFNEQLAYMDQNNKKISVGDMVEGEVVSVNDTEAYINIRYKSEAELPLKEVTREDVKLSSILKVGDMVNAKVIKTNPPVVSIIEIKRQELNAERELNLKELKEIFDANGTITVTIKEVVKGGLLSSYKASRVFIPASHLELFHIADLNDYVGKEIDVKIIEFEVKRFPRIVASRRELLKDEKQAKEDAAWNLIQKDTVVEGEVKRISNFGAFIDMNGIDGLLHVSEMSWSHVVNPTQVVKVGDKIKVYVLDMDTEKRKISLSLKKLSENPWENVETKYPVGSIVLGKVVRFAAFGAFVELEPGVDGLVHISHISEQRINKADEVLTLGSEIKAKILDVNKEAKKIGLSIREVEVIE